MASSKEEKERVQTPIRKHENVDDEAFLHLGIEYAECAAFCMT